MGALGSNGHVSSTTVSVDTDLGSGGVLPMPPAEGFPLGVFGFGSGTFNNNYAEGALVYVRTSGQLFSIQKGALGLCAVLIATLSATSGGPVTGSALLYVVAPASLGLAGSYTTIGAAVAAAVGQTYATIIVLAGAYTETASITLRTGLSIIGQTGVSLSGELVNPVNVTMDPGVKFDWSADPGSVTIQGIVFDYQASGLALITVSASGSFLTLSHVRTIGTPATRAVDSGVKLTLTLDNVSLASANAASNCVTNSVSTSENILRYATIRGIASLSNLTASNIDIDQCVINGVCSIVDFRLGSANAVPPLVLATTTELNIQKGTLQASAGAGYLISSGGLVASCTAIEVSRRIDNASDLTVDDIDPAITLTTSGLTTRGEGGYRTSTVQAANFDISPGGDEQSIDPSVNLILGTLPYAAAMLNCRRIVLRNTSATITYGVIPRGAEKFEENTNSQPVWVPPLSEIEITPDRAAGRWRRITPRGGPSIYRVAKPESFAPGSFPSITDALVQIDRDKAVNPALTAPVIEVEAGTYTENISVSYGITIRGSSIDPTAVKINGTLTLNADANSISVQNLTVLNATLLTETSGGNITASNCIFDARTKAVDALSLGSTNANVVRVFDCIVLHDAANRGIFVNTDGDVDLHHNQILTPIAVNIYVQGCNKASIVDNLLTGGASFLNTVPVTFRMNTHGVFDGGGIGVGVSCGANHIVDNNIFVPNANTDVAVSTFGAGTAETTGFYATAACAGYYLGTTDAVRGHLAKKIVAYDAVGALDPLAPIHVFNAGSSGTYTMPVKTVYPQGALLHFVNDSGGAVTLSDGAGTNFVPGATATYVIADQTAVIIAVDVINNRWLIVSAL